MDSNDAVKDKTKRSRDGGQVQRKQLACELPKSDRVAIARGLGQTVTDTKDFVNIHLSRIYSILCQTGGSSCSQVLAEWS